jgi:hypothetical protein
MVLLALIRKIVSMLMTVDREVVSRQLVTSSVGLKCSVEHLLISPKMKTFCIFVFLILKYKSSPQKRFENRKRANVS